MAVAGGTTELLLTPARLRIWGWLSALSLVDQGLTSRAGHADSVRSAKA
jgi:hypothetical protein